MMHSCGGGWLSYAGAAAVAYVGVVWGVSVEGETFVVRADVRN